MTEKEFNEILRDYNDYYSRGEMSKEEYERFEYWLDKQAEDVDWDHEYDDE